MTMYELASKNYIRKLWTDDMLVKLVEKGKLTTAEYNEITGDTIADPNSIETIRERKLTSLSADCQDTIVNGVDVTLTDGTTEHFSLTATDQTNIDNIFNAVVLGATEYPYHADDEACKMYSATDIVNIYVTAKTLVTYHTTYYNSLKQWINRLEDADTIKAISYGDTLPDDLLTSMNEILASAKNQMDAIISKMTITETANV